jgi:putative ABC transport system permease protein
MQDFKAALRGLGHRPGFSAIAILTLALGIGANAAIFSVIDPVLVRALPYKEPHRLVLPWAYSAELQQRTGFDRLPWSPGDVTDLIARNRTFESLAWMRADRVNLTGEGEPERIGAVRVSGNFFQTLGVQAIHGRAFTAGDAVAGRVVLIGYALWQRRFGGDAAVLSRPISLNGQPAIVTGVLPAWFRFPAAGELPEGLGYSPNPEIWTLDVLTPEMQRSRAGKSFALIGRVGERISMDAAQAELAAIAADIAREFPASNAGWTVRVFPLREQLVGGVRPALIVLLTAVWLLLLIACVNVANLLLVRASGRHREVCVRRALGADRRRLVRQLLLESVVLAVVAGAAGLLLAWLGLRLLLAMLPPGLPALATAGLDWRVTAFTFAVSLLTGVTFGLVPALQTTRLDVGEALREGGRGSAGSRRARRTRNILVVAEVAVAIVLLVGAVLLVQTFVRLLHVDPGFRSERVLTAEIALPRMSYSGSRAPQFFDALAVRLARVPGIEGVAVTSSLPLAGTENLRQVTIEGRPRPQAGQEIISDYRIVTPEYFRIMGIPHVQGDLLLPGRTAGSPPVLLINKTMAETWFREENPIGRRIKLTSYEQAAPWFTIAGIVGDTRHTKLDSDLRPQVYVDHQLEPNLQMTVVLRTVSDPAGFAAVVRAAVHELDSKQPVGRIRTMTAVVTDSVSDRRFTMFLAGTFALLALVLSLVGLYAVVSHSVAERTQEMGVRLALGATPAMLLRLVLGEALRLVALGAAIGLAAALVLTRLIERLLFGVAAHDLATFVAVPLLLLTASLLGCILPARRAMRVEPIVALRAE